MEMAAAAMDFHALSRRELQALCKRNGVRANMTNVAMAEALQSLPSVDGIDEIGTTLCLPTPGKSALKTAAAAAGEDQKQQHGSPLPRGRRVSVKSPEAIRMDVEEGEDEMKRDIVKEIVRTPGVALRSSSRRARATPAPIPTPAASTMRTTARRSAARKTEEALPTPATLLRSQRATARKAGAAVEEEVWTAKRTTRRSARSKVMIALDQEEEVAARRSARSKVMVALDQEEEVAAPPEEQKVQEEEPKGVASDEKCDDPDEEEPTKLLEEGNSKEEEPEQDEEESAVVSERSCDDTKVEEVVEEEATKQQEVAGIGEEQELISVEKSAPVPTMKDSPILGVLSKEEATGPVIEKVEDASVGDGGEGFGEWSPVKEITDEINRVSEDKEVAAAEVSEEAVKEDGFVFTGETGDANKMLPAAVTDDETTEEDDLNEEKVMAADEMPQADLTDAETTEEDDLDEETSEEDDLDEEEEAATNEIPQDDLTDDDATAEIGSTYVTEENGETDEESDSTEETIKDDDSSEEEDDFSGDDDSSGEEDDFSGDLPPVFDNAGNFSDAETENDTTPPVPEEIIAASVASSAAKAAVKSLDDSTITEELEVSSEEKVASTLDTIVKSLDEFTITERQVSEVKNESEAVGAKEKKQKLKLGGLGAQSLRKLRAMYKEELIAAKEGKNQVAAEGKRRPLAELDDNACVDC